jgi:DNA-binding GntR family transcriptional regulator
VTGVTLVEQAKALIRRDILNGQLEPGSRLGVHALANRYGIGTTPVREALARLSAAGFVIAIEQRGFRVSDLNRKDLEDLVTTRIVIETEALKLAMAQGDDQWEADILGALHRLERFSSARGPRAFHDFPAEYDVLHKQFHSALIRACNSTRLVQFHAMLYEQTFRYRSFLMAKDSRLRTVDDEHARIAELVIKRDADAACAAISLHLRSLLDL